MTKKIVALFFVLTTLICHGQVNISALLPPGGLIQKNQLWNLTLVNNRDAGDIYIRMNLQDVVSGEIVLSANTTNFLIQKGATLLSRDRVEPVLYNYISPDFAKDFLPLGTYVACYRAYATGAKGEEPLGEECIKLTIDPLSPPLLNTPTDTAELQTPYPQFTWIPPSPFDMFTNLTYEINIAEIKEGQKPIEAVQYNLPVYSRAGISQPFEQYSSAYSPLEEGKEYAWQVTAFNGFSYAAKTEVWRFRIKKDSIKQIISLAPYISLNNIPASLSISHQGILKMEIQNSSTDSVGQFILRNISKANSTDNTIGRFELKLLRGKNFLEFDMNRYGKLKKDEVYEVEYLNSRKESSFMRFKVVYYN